MFRGVDVEYGSVQEAILIAYYNHSRQKDLAIGIGSIPPSDNATNIFENIKGAIFPEARVDNVARLKKSSELMKGLSKDGIYVKPLTK